MTSISRGGPGRDSLGSCFWKNLTWSFLPFQSRGKALHGEFYGPRPQGHYSPWVITVLHCSKAHTLCTGCPRKRQHQSLQEASYFAEVAAANG